MRYMFIDTSFLISAIDLGKDLISIGENYIDEAIIPATSKQVLDELGLLARENDKKIELAKKIASRFKVFEASSSNADDSLIELCIEKKGILATADLELMNKARDRGIPVLFLKANKKLVYFER
ncbi:MAG TPA: hypothetical protein VKU94_05325 [Geobacterales bacterium]|nr:hypothetical protein [Geobacterales bacterium]